MKRLMLITSLCVFAAGMITAGCVSRKDRVSSDTVTISIEPSGLSTIPQGSQVQLRAICRSAKSDDADISPTWFVENNLGTFNPPAGKTTVFTAANTNGGGKIFAMYGSIRSNEVFVPIGTYQLPLVLLADSGYDPDFDRYPAGSSQLYLHYYDTTDSAPWQIYTQEVFPGCPLDPAKSIQVDYHNIPGGWGGFYLQYSAPKNITAYTNLTFWIKGAAGNEKLKIGMKDNSAPFKVNLADHAAISTDWQKVTIPLTAFIGVSKGSITQPFIIAFEHGYTGADARVSIDFIRLEP